MKKILLFLTLMCWSVWAFAYPGDGSQRVTNLPNHYQKVFDYGVRTDGQPDYMGIGDEGSSTASNSWVIKQYTYDGSNNCTNIKTAVGAWDDRTSLIYR